MSLQNARIQIEFKLKRTFVCLHEAINYFSIQLALGGFVGIGIQSKFESVGLTIFDLFLLLCGVSGVRSTWERAPGIGNNQRHNSLKHAIVSGTVGRRGGKLPGISLRGRTDIC